MSEKARLWVYVPNSLLETIQKETQGDKDQARSKSAWIVSACEQYLILRDQKQDQDCDQVRQRVQELMISSAMLEERAKNQAMVIEEIRTRAVHAEGMVQQLMAERQALLPQKTGFWSRLFGRE